MAYVVVFCLLAPATGRTELTPEPQFVHRSASNLNAWANAQIECSNHFANGPLPVELRVVIELKDTDPLRPSVQDGTVLATSRLTELNYDSQPVAQPADGETRASILGPGGTGYPDSRVRESTAMFTVTHGHPTGFYDSFSQGQASLLTFAEVAQHVGAKGRLPLYDFVWMYACETLPDGAASSAPSAFFGLDTTDRAYFGFVKPVFAECLPEGARIEPDEEMPVVEYVFHRTKALRLSVHMEVLLSHLSGGKQAVFALHEANEAWQCLTLDQSAPNASAWVVRENKMRRVGDMDARLTLVYLTATERLGLSQQEINQWYHVFLD